MRRFIKGLTLLIAVAGPSIITTMAGNDGGGVITYSLAGAQFGYGLLILLPVLTLIYGLSQEIGSRIAIVSGRGMADIIRERYGVKMSVFMFLLFFFANLGTMITNAAAIRASLEIFGLHHLWIVAAFVAIIVVLFAMVTKLDYKTNQKVFMASMFLYIAYFISAFNSRPDWGAALKALVIPTPETFSAEAVVASIAFVGTTITPWGQFFIQSYMKDKKLPTEHIPLSQIEAYFGAFISNLCTFFIVVATMATLYVNKIPLRSGADAALAIEPFAGKFSAVLFGAGLFNAGIIGLIIVGLSTSYAFTEFFGFEGTLDVGYTRGKNFYRLFLFQLVLAIAIVLLPSVSAFKIAQFTQSFNGVLLPLIFLILIKTSSDKGLMREYVVDVRKRWLLGASGVVIVIASSFSIIYSLFQ